MTRKRGVEVQESDAKKPLGAWNPDPSIHEVHAVREDGVHPDGRGGAEARPLEGLGGHDPEGL